MITSYDNKRIKNVVSLCEKSKARKEQDAFVIEGIKLFEEAPDSAIKEVFVAESFSYKSEKLDRMNKINEKERTLRWLRLLKESGDNDSRPFDSK